MKRFLGFILILMMFTSIELFAETIIIDPGSGTGWAGATGAIAFFKDELSTSRNMAKIGHQNKLASGFANANTYAANSASFAGYEGYDIFAFMWGLSAGAVMPSDGSVDSDKIKDEKDVDLGAGISSAFNLGINLTNLGLDLLPNRLYMSIKFFTFSIDGNKGQENEWSYKTTTFGIGLNYQLVDRGGDRFRAFKWTGLSVGTGFIYNKNKIVFHTKLDEENYKYDDGGDRYLTFEPNTQFGLDVSTYTIPIELSTSVRLLWLFNFTLGAGVDMNFGTSKIVAKADSPIYIYNGTPGSGTPLVGSTNGMVHIDGTTSERPDLLNPKVMFGFGLCLGPIPIDARITYYPGSNIGLAANIGTGIVW